jgi:hypothetical protein
MSNKVAVMLGRIVVRLFAAVLNIVGALAILGGTLFGAYYMSENSGVFALLSTLPGWTHAILGLVAGFVASFMCVVLLFGVPFLIVEIHRNGLWLAADDAGVEVSGIPLTPDLV